MAPTKRKANISSSSSSRPSSSNNTSSSSSTSSKKSAKEKRSPKNNIYKRRGQKFVNDSQIVEKFKPCAIIKQGKIVDLEFEGKKSKIIRQMLKETKCYTKIYKNENNKLIVPFFREASVFSNFHPSIFNVCSRTFCCNEQFFHFCKAIAFADQAIAEKIMQTKTPKAQKRLGKQVAGFNPSIWEPISILSMVIGLMKKFEQNETMRNELLATGEAELIEASPFDAKWGAGKGANQIISGESWTGKNFLGRILMAIRQQLISPNSPNNLISQNLQLNSSSFSRIAAFSTESELYLANSLINEFGII